MVTIKTIPDRQRLAVVRAGRFRRLVGPGIVFLLALPGMRHQRIALGDRGQLMTMNQARFGDMPLPVVLRGTATSGTVRVVGFRDDAVVVAAEDADAATTEEALLPEQEAVRRVFSPRHFWIGLPVVIFFSAVAWAGFLYAANQILIERQLYERGVLTTGTIIEKISRGQRQNSRITYYVAYEFRTSAEDPIRNESRVESALLHRLKKGGDIAIRYLLDNPTVNIPDGRHLDSLYYWAGGFSLVGALLFSAILIGMLVKKFAGGYRGESHPFLGERAARRGKPT